MLLLYNHVKAYSVQHSITELLDSDNESKNLEDSEDEGSDTKWEDDGDMITSTKGSIKGKDKDMASGFGKKKAGKGVKRKRSKVQEEENWLEDDEQDDEGMETDNDYVTPPPKKKNKKSPVITDIRPNKGNNFLNVQPNPLDPNKRTNDVEEDEKMVKEGDTLSPNDKTTSANMETLDNTALEINIDRKNSPLTMLNTMKSEMMDLCKVIDWVYSEMDSFKKKQEDSSKKVDTLEFVGTGKLSTLPNYLNELTKAIGDAEAITYAYGSQFKVVEARLNDLVKQVLNHENTLKKIGEQSQIFLKASADNFSVMISKLE
ncbi:uncharacterized protein LOC131856802 [Cryptomeria japonica]|uniref:uncharacterized protein LOC131856802 n=1 Tax=Cryptomeria japonica TaxID=3369 RepID=UPI0027D9E0F3|nr:uncharacterized protein LOC131856802 [Cryptomeria japonica]